jgi:hypothetical protein
MMRRQGDERDNLLDPRWCRSGFDHRGSKVGDGESTRDARGRRDGVDDIVEICVIEDTADPRWVRWVRVGDRGQRQNRRSENQIQHIESPDAHAPLLLVHTSDVNDDAFVP